MCLCARDTGLSPRPKKYSQLVCITLYTNKKYEKMVDNLVSWRTPVMHPVVTHNIFLSVACVVRKKGKLFHDGKCCATRAVELGRIGTTRKEFMDEFRATLPLFKSFGPQCLFNRVVNRLHCDSACSWYGVHERNDERRASYQVSLGNATHKKIKMKRCARN